MTSTNICEMWAEKLAARQPEDLSPAERAALNAHVASCPRCSAIRQDYDLLTRRIHALCTPVVKLSPPDPAHAPWHTHRLGRSGQEQRDSERFGQKASRMLREWPSRRIGVGITLAAASVLVALLVVTTSLPALFQASSSPQKLTSVAVQQRILTGVAKGFTKVCPLPPDQSNANCLARYTGSYTSILSDSITPMTLVVQQHQRVIRGSCTLSLFSNTVSVPISGSVDEKGNFTFDVTISRNLIIHFIGSVYSNGSMSGTYTTSAGEQGTWTVKLSQSLTPQEHDDLHLYLEEYWKWPNFIGIGRCLAALSPPMNRACGSSPHTALIAHGVSLAPVVSLSALLGYG